MNKLFKFIIGQPLKNLGISFFLLFLVMAGMSKLTANFGYRTFFEPDNPKLIQFDEFERKFGSDELAIIAIESKNGVFDTETINLVQKLTADMWLAPEVIRVDSLTNFNYVYGENDDIFVEPLLPDDVELTKEYLDKRKAISIKHRSIEGYLVNKKATVAMIYVRLKPALKGTPDYERITTEFRKIINKYQGVDNHKIFLTGNPILNYAFQESSQKDMTNLLPIVFLMTIIFLFVMFKRVTGVVLPLIMIIFTILATMGITGWIGFEISTITAIVPQFMVAISVAVSVHLLLTFFDVYKKGLSKEEAIMYSLEKNFRPTLLTTLSTAIGFFSFSTSVIPPLGNLGIMSGCGTLMSWMITYSMLPSLLSLIPIKQKNVKKVLELNDASDRSLAITNTIFKFRHVIVVVFSIITVFSVYYTTKVEVNSDPFKYFSEDYPLTKATTFLEKNLGGAVGVEIVIDSGVEEGIKEPEFLNKVESLQLWLDDFSFVTKTVSVVDILKQMNQVLNGGSEASYRLPKTKESTGQQLFLYTMNLPQGMDLNDRMSNKNDSLRLTVMSRLHDSKEFLVFIKQVESKAKELGLMAHVTGKMPLYQSNNPLVVKSFSFSITLAIILVALLMCFGLRSIKTGLFSMIPNTIPLLIGAGSVYLRGKSLDVGTVLVGSICMGIAVDDTIHFLAHYRKYIDDGDDVKTAIAKVFTHTGGALITTTIVLVASFATFMFASFVPNQDFGVFVAIILTMALILDLTFLPALLMIFNRVK